MLLKSLCIAFLSERIGTAKKFRANEIYAHVRVVLIKVDLWLALCSSRTKSQKMFGVLLSVAYEIFPPDHEHFESLA